jgi:hypothetical protein
MRLPGGWGQDLNYVSLGTTRYHAGHSPVITMETITVIPAAPSPLITLPRITCHIDAATPLWIVSADFSFFKHGQMTYMTPHPIPKRTYEVRRTSFRPKISLSFPVRGCTAHTLSMKPVDSQLASPKAPNSEEIVPYVASTRLPSALEMKTPVIY